MARVATRRTTSFIGVCGDVHGHLQLALCAWALEQRYVGQRLDAVLLCGDVGTFIDVDATDRATARHAVENPCEVEFLQWASAPPAPWLEGIFAPAARGGLGLDAPVIMVHGNHEGFEHLELLLSDHETVPAAPVEPLDLPAVDPLGRIRLLPPGWRVRTSDGIVVGGVGGIQPGQRRRAGYPPMAYIDAGAVDALRVADELDIILTHQGPARVQGPSSGAAVLDPLLDRPDASVWFHGHSRARREPLTVGHTQVIPLGDATFQRRDGWRVRDDAWHTVTRIDGHVTAYDRSPRALTELPRHAWLAHADGYLIAPPLAAFVT